MPGRIDFTMGFNTQESARKNNGINGFRIYVMGDFSGHSESSWRERKIRRIDIDNFDQVMAQIEPCFSNESGLQLRFHEPDDFHPDAWLNKIPILADLLQLKKDLADPRTAQQAASKIQAFYQHDVPAETPQPAEPVTESRDHMLDRLLGGHPSAQQAPPGTVDKLIDQVVSPYVKQETEPQHEFLRGVIDTMIGQFLTTLLHQPDFQRLEALWRATEALVNEENADEQQFFLVDINQRELQTELQAGDNAFAQSLLEHIQSDEEGSDILLIGDYDFSTAQVNQTLLAFFGGLAKACNGRFLGSADISLLEQALSDNAESSNRWKHYLDKIDAGNILLSYPRYLQRLPYGEKRNPLETLPFEECSAIPENGELLWGNPAFLCARALIRPDQSPYEERLFFNDISVFSYQKDGEPVLQAGTETLLNESQANTLLGHGFIPVIGFRQRQGVKLLALSNLAS